jgi:hypothetical protein
MKNGPWISTGREGIGRRCVKCVYTRVRLRPHPVARVASVSTSLFRNVGARWSDMVRKLGLCRTTVKTVCGGMV